MAGIPARSERERRSLAQQLAEDDVVELSEEEVQDTGVGITKFLEEPDVSQERIPAERQPNTKKAFLKRYYKDPLFITALCDSRLDFIVRMLSREVF